ncbi:hypothetical protein [Dyadobacter sp. CY351]|uniref:hypothetical protein n=1 Tax=Dyadobacter sp. CY351 TaxID=2909337 RepID=UPI001F43C7D2|nr:hypothetical protein [Dyadobacter sp. CY351]MCF2516034.1 hypothetical protein [Dyadobacter sp. CY351]
MAYSTLKTNSIPFTPALFQRQEAAYDPKATDRKSWLKNQIINVEFGIYQYKATLDGLAFEAARLDGKSDTAEWMQTVGILIVGLDIKGSGEGDGEKIAKYSKAAGAAMIAAGIVINIFEKRKDDKRLKQMRDEAVKLSADLQLLEGYRQRYENEAIKMTILPILLFSTAAYIFSENY